MKYFLFLLLFVSLVCCATVYMQTDKNGDTTYSDSASPNAVAIVVPEGGSISSAPPPPPPKADKNSLASGGDAPALGPIPYKPYTSFTLTSPVDQQTFQNQRDIPVEFSMEPALQRQDSIQVYVDGVPNRQPWSTPHAAIYQVDRGTHTIYAELLDNSKKVVKRSNTVTVFIHYAALGG
jgi:hypothetical protein